MWSEKTFITLRYPMRCFFLPIARSPSIVKRKLSICSAGLRRDKRHKLKLGFRRFSHSSIVVYLPKIVPQPHQNPVVFRLSRSHSTYLSDIHQCLQEIEEGETYQVCLTNQIYTEATPDPLSFYRILRQINPAPYSAFFRFSDLAIACSSPESFCGSINRIE